MGTQSSSSGLPAWDPCSPDMQLPGQHCIVHPRRPAERVLQRTFAMQPIFTVDRNLLAFELLYRRAEGDRRYSGDPDLASNLILDNVLLFGLDELSVNSLLFINCTRETLIGGFFSLLPHHAVVEVLETVYPDPEVLAACQFLKGCGYRISIDDFADPKTMRPFLDLADFVKIDFRHSDARDRQILNRELQGRNLIRIAEKIETEDEFHIAADEGFSFFQGNLLSPPITFTKTRSCPCPLRLRELAEMVLSPAASIEERAEAISRFPEIETRLLVRAAWKEPHDGCSLLLEQALEIVGMEELRQLINLAIITK